MNSLHPNTTDFCQMGKQWGMCTTLGAHMILAALLFTGWPSVATQVLPAPAVAQEQAVLSLRVMPAPKKAISAPPKAAPQTLPDVPAQPLSPLSPVTPERPKAQEQVRPTKNSAQARTAKAPSKKATTQASPSPAASATAPPPTQAHSPAAGANPAAHGDTTQAHQTAQARQTVLRYFMALLEQYKHYPRAARKLGLEGRITVELRLDAQGNIAHLAIGAADAHPMLQKALGESLQKIRSHWQPQPTGHAGGQAEGQALSLTVPVRFSLQDAK